MRTLVEIEHIYEIYCCAAFRLQLCRTNIF